MSLDVYNTYLAPLANPFDLLTEQRKRPGSQGAMLMDPSDILEPNSLAPCQFNQDPATQRKTLELLMQSLLSLIGYAPSNAPSRNNEPTKSFGGSGHGRGSHGNNGCGNNGYGSRNNGGSSYGSGYDGGGKGSHGSNGNHGNSGSKASGGSKGSGSNGSPVSQGGGHAGRPLNGNQEFQASHKDSMSRVKDPVGGRSDVVRIGFNEGRLTANSTSPRAEVKHCANLKEGSTYNVKFGYMREKNTNTTLWQVLDHNGSKPKPRAWISVRDGNYVLNLRENGDSNGGVKKYNLGPARPGKWDDFDIDFKRGKGNGGIEVKINGRSVFHKEGIATMFDNNSTNAYFKYGQYRNQGDRSPAPVYYSGFRVSEL